MAPDCQSLLKALVAKPAEAEAYWRRWRAETDPDKMSEDCVRLLPVVISRSPSWLAGDPARNLMLGLAKRAWTRNQLMLRSLTELVGSLARAGIAETAIAGPAAWALVYQGEKAFRPVFFFELLIPRDRVLAAAAALDSLGWVVAPGQALPRPEQFDYMEGVWFRNQAGEGLKLTWRLLPAPPERAAEWESVPLDTVEFQGTTLRIPRRDVMLACALAGYREGDHLDWRCDAVPVLSGGDVDWGSVRKWIRFSPEARSKLLELAHEDGAAIPADLRRRPVGVWFRWELVWGDYGRRAEIRGESHSLRGLFRYLCDRWQTPAWRTPFLGLFYLVRYTFSRR